MSIYTINREADGLLGVYAVEGDAIRRIASAITHHDAMMIVCAQGPDAVFRPHPGMLGARA